MVLAQAQAQAKEIEQLLRKTLETSMPLIVLRQARAC